MVIFFKYIKEYWFVLLIVIGLLLAFVLDSNGLRKDLKLSKEKNKILHKQIDSLNNIYNLLSKEKQKEIVRYVKIKELIKQKEDETDSITNNVYTMDEQQLDRAIRNYKHPKRN